MRLDRKAFGRVATTFMATAMLAAVAAVPAMADDSLAANQFEITKTFTAEANTFRPKADFSFTVKTAEVTSEQEAAGYYDGVGTVTMVAGSGSFDADAGTTPTLSANKNVRFNVTFGTGGITHAGTYKYTVQEDVGTVKGVTYDTTQYDLYIVVENDDDPANANHLKVTGAVMTKAGESPDEELNSGKLDSIINTYDNKSGGGDGFNELRLTKTITGDGADLSGEFNFEVTINGSQNNATSQDRYYYEVGTIQQDGTFKPSGNGTIVETAIDSNTFVLNPISLGNNETLIVYGLLDGDTYTIVETAHDQNGYKTKVQKDSDTQVEYKDAGTVLTNVNVGTAAGSDNKVNITVNNNRDPGDVPATGIIMNVAPYVLMVIIAAAACFVFLRKRRDD